jgi:hypothetical protein
MKKFHYICEFNNETQEGFISALNMQEAVKKLERKRYKIIQLKEFFNEINTNVNIDPFTITEKKEFYCVTRCAIGKHRQIAYSATVQSTMVAPEGISARYEI